MMPAAPSSPLVDRRVARPSQHHGGDNCADPQRAEQNAVAGGPEANRWLAIRGSSAHNATRGGDEQDRPQQNASYHRLVPDIAAAGPERRHEALSADLRSGRRPAPEEEGDREEEHG